MKYKIVKTAAKIMITVTNVLYSAFLLKSSTVLENDSVSGIIPSKILLNGNNIIQFIIKMSIANAIILFSTEACPRNAFPFKPMPFINFINLVQYLRFWFLCILRFTKKFYQRKIYKGRTPNKNVKI